MQRATDLSANDGPAVNARSRQANETGRRHSYHYQSVTARPAVARGRYS